MVHQKWRVVMGIILMILLLMAAGMMKCRLTVMLVVVLAV